MSVAQGAYSCVLLTKDALFAFRDPLGMRPLALGKIVISKSNKHSNSQNGLHTNSTQDAKKSPRFKPLVASSDSLELEQQTCWIIASESCAFSTIKAEFVRDVRPGEIIRIDKDGTALLFTFTKDFFFSPLNTTLQIYCLSKRFFLDKICVDNFVCVR